MQYALVATDDQGESQTFPLETIQIIPKDVDLLVSVPAETIDSDFYDIVEQVQKHLGHKGRQVVVTRMGDITISGIERP